MAEIIGTNENDTLVGGVEGDTMTGGAGADRLTGGAGVDIFVFGGSDSPDSAGLMDPNLLDVITDWSAGDRRYRDANSHLFGSGERSR